ncbi:MAG TPA: hypothetical protein VGC01_13035, partial [Mucilaginibacter sp.]
MEKDIATGNEHWTVMQRIAFRFFAMFFALYVFFNPNGLIPFTYGLFNLYLKPFRRLVLWLGNHLLHPANPFTTYTGGSGDTTYDYLALAFIVIVSIVTAIVWSVTGKGTRNYNKLFYWLLVIIRYYVAFAMIRYGIMKVVKIQFPYPSIGRLMEPVGNMSPMSLAWMYMGYSKAF